MSKPSEEASSSSANASRIWRSGAWGWLALTLCFGFPLVWCGAKYFVASQVTVGKYGFYRVERLNHPAPLTRWVGRDGLEILKPARLVDITPQKGDADAGIRWLRWQKKLTKLRYRGPTHTLATFSLIADNCPELQALGLYDVMLSSNDLHHIGRLKSLNTLQLVNCQLSEPGLSQLETMPMLKVLVYEHGLPLSKALLREMAGLKNIESIILSIDDAGLVTLCQPLPDGSPALPNLKQLTLHYSHIKGTSLSGLASLPELTHLTLSETKVDDQALRQLEPATKLRQLYLAHCPITDEGCQSLAKLPRLESLHLGATNITIDGVRQLTGLPRLRQLDVKQCYRIRHHTELRSLPKSFLSRCRLVY